MAALFEDGVIPLDKVAVEICARIDGRSQDDPNRIYAKVLSDCWMGSCSRYTIRLEGPEFSVPDLGKAPEDEFRYSMRALTQVAYSETHPINDYPVMQAQGILMADFAENCRRGQMGGQSAAVRDACAALHPKRRVP